MEGDWSYADPHKLSTPTGTPTATPNGTPTKAATVEEGGSRTIML